MGLWPWRWCWCWCLTLGTLASSFLQFFLPSYAATGNRTHVSRVAPPGRALSQDALPTEVPRPGQKKQQQPGHDSRVGNEHGGVRQTNIFPPAPSFKTFRKFSPCRPFSRTSIVGFVGLEFDGNKISMEKHSKEFLSLSLQTFVAKKKNSSLLFQRLKG